MEGMNVNSLKVINKTLTCLECGADFAFTIGEQRYFLSKGLSTPKRCARCRQRRRDTLVPDRGGQQ